jgi:holo-[acyl-carrier protein] synthase
MASVAQLVVGVDMVRVGDVAESIARFGDRYTHRIFTEEEIRYCSAHERADERYAARFAAKEATIKVLRPRPDESVEWRTIEVRRAPEGWCDVLLHGAAEELAARNGIAGLALSLSHENGFAIAVVVGHRSTENRN